MSRINSKNKARNVLEEGAAGVANERMDGRVQDAEKAPVRWWIPMTAGTFAGVLTAGIFNPVDRALYLSVIRCRPFLSRRNWSNPFHGAANALLHRTISGGLYFAVYDILKEPVGTHIDRLGFAGSEKGSIFKSFITGNLAGFFNGVVLNPIAAVKYAAWGSDTSSGLGRYAISLWRKGRHKPFIAGVRPTICRDMIFGGGYSSLRFVLANNLKDVAQLTSFASSTQKMRAENLIPLISQFLAAAFATSISSPLNYWRNVQFNTVPGQEAITFKQCMKDLVNEIRVIPDYGGKVRHLGIKFRIGWGTLRVGLGMALGQQLFDSISSSLQLCL